MRFQLPVKIGKFPISDSNLVSMGWIPRCLRR